MPSSSCVLSGLLSFKMNYKPTQHMHLVQLYTHVANHSNTRAMVTVGTCESDHTELRLYAQQRRGQRAFYSSSANAKNASAAGRDPEKSCLSFTSSLVARAAVFILEKKTQQGSPDCLYPYSLPVPRLRRPGPGRRTLK